VACAAALASIDTMRGADLAAAARVIGGRVHETLSGLKATHPAVGDVRGRGAMMAMEIVRPGGSDPDPEATRRIAHLCHQAGVIVLTCGSYGNVIRLLPPLVIEEELLADGLGVLVGAVDQVLSGRA
jgi:4-aminobutyrate aminotransferase/(S)-3-amino-2-methylpropionate transaminase